VGDILFIAEETLFPADLIILESSADGFAFI
jgi:magnesium-transporting ATPase (P-type)